jgi:ABC-2 type transport system permease protein
MTVVPICMALFFVSLLGEGLPKRVPAAIVDLDHSQTSRQMARSLEAMELIDIKGEFDSYNKAMDAVQRGDIYGFFMIPDDFERDAIGGRGTKLTFYSNLTFYVPGTLVFKGFKTVAVTTTGGLVTATLVSAGADPAMVGSLIQPMTVQEHPLGNPWLSYSIYLCPSFIYGVLALMIFLTTAFAITMEIKNGTSSQWLAVALVGKLLPHTVIFSVVGLGIMSLLWGYCHFPVAGSLWWMALAVLLFVMACQAMALFVVSVFPNPRLSLSVLSLLGILSFSLTGFSFPVQSMYGALAIFSYAIPVRYLFLIYVSDVLNGWPIYYVRLYYVALILFVPIGCTLAWRLKKACLKPVYVP